MPQCTTGTPKTYGAEFDLAYTTNRDWDSRRDSLKEGGPLNLGTAHLHSCGTHNRV